MPSGPVAVSSASTAAGVGPACGPPRLLGSRSSFMAAAVSPHGIATAATAWAVCSASMPRSAGLRDAWRRAPSATRCKAASSAGESVGSLGGIDVSTGGAARSGHAHL